jgi:DNA replication protein DnaC
MTPEEIAAHDEEVKRAVEKHAEEEREARFRKTVPERYWGETFDTYEVKNEMQKKALQSVRAFKSAIERKGFKTLVMLGSPGVGKTHLACSLIREHEGGKYRKAPDIIEELRRAKSFTADETEEQIVNYYGRVPLLVIDEIGRGINATDEKYMLYQVLNARYNTRRPTVLISNFEKSDFLAYIGVAAADRLVESAEIVELNGESYRRILRGQK